MESIGVRDIDGAREALRAATREHGAQSRLAREAGVPAVYISRILTQGGRPSLTLRASLERLTGIPAGAWSVERWTRQKAADAVAVQLGLEPYPGYTAARCGVTPEALRSVLAGRELAPEGMRAWASGIGVPPDAWDE